MARKVGYIKLTLFGLLGTIMGAVIAILLRPSYPVDSPLYSSYVDKPTLPTMITRGIPGTDPTNRTALIYLIVGLILGGLIGAILAYITSAKKV